MLKIKIAYAFLEFETLPPEITDDYRIDEHKGKYRVIAKPEKLYNLLFELSKTYDIDLI